MDKTEKIMQVLRMNGPVIPNQIAKAIGTDIIMASAMLSELCSKGIVKISSVKLGSSPLYYLPGQESRLQNYSSNLHEKERKAYELLKQEKVLRDSELEPVTRVALRGIKDFAIPLNVRVAGKEEREIFWKWYLLQNPEAEALIRKILEKSQPQIEEKPKQEQVNEKAPETPLPEEKPQQQAGQDNAEEQKKDSEQKQEISQDRNNQTEPKIEETQDKDDEQEKQEPKKQFLHDKEQLKQETRTFVDKTGEDKFFREVKRFFDKNSIEIVEHKLIKKNSEIDMVVEVPSVVGTLIYYCKAKSKKRISDSDLSSAFVQGQLKKLPVLFIAKGDLTKKAQEFLSGEFRSIKLKKI